MVGAIKKALPKTAQSAKTTGSARSTSVTIRNVVHIGAIRKIFIEDALSFSQRPNGEVEGPGDTAGSAPRAPWDSSSGVAPRPHTVPQRPRRVTASASPPDQRHRRTSTYASRPAPAIVRFRYRVLLRRSALRVCHPGPVAFQREMTSSGSRIEMSFLGLSERGRPPFFTLARASMSDVSCGSSRYSLALTQIHHGPLQRWLSITADFIASSHDGRAQTTRTIAVLARCAVCSTVSALGVHLGSEVSHGGLQ